MSKPFTQERLEELKTAVPALISSLDKLKAYTALGRDGKPRLVFELELSDQEGAIAAETIFHGNDMALKTNSYTVLGIGLMQLLPQAVCELCRTLAEDPGEDDTTEEEVPDE